MRLGDLDELYGIVKLHDIDIIRNNKTASWLLDQILFDIQESPTIDKNQYAQQLEKENLMLKRSREALIHYNKLIDSSLTLATEEKNAAINALTKIIREDCNPCIYCGLDSEKCKGFNPDFCDDFKWKFKMKSVLNEEI